MKKAYISALLLKIILPLLLYECLFYGLAILFRLTPDALNDGRTSLPLQSAAAALSVLILGIQYRKEMGDGLSVPDLPGAGQCAVLLLTGVLSGAAGNLLLNLTNLPENSAAFHDAAQKLSGTSLLLQLAGVVILIPLCEEMIYRGMAFRYLRENLPLMKAAVISSLLFAVMHGNPVQGIYAFSLGIVLSLLYEKYHRLLPVYLVHAAANLTAIAMPFAIPADIRWSAVLASGLACAAAAVIILHFIVRHR